MKTPLEITVEDTNKVKSTILEKHGSEFLKPLQDDLQIKLNVDGLNAYLASRAQSFAVPIVTEDQESEQSGTAILTPAVLDESHGSYEEMQQEFAFLSGVVHYHNREIEARRQKLEQERKTIKGRIAQLNSNLPVSLPDDISIYKQGGVWIDKAGYEKAQTSVEERKKAEASIRPKLDLLEQKLDTTIDALAEILVTEKLWYEVLAEDAGTYEQLDRILGIEKVARENAKGKEEGEKEGDGKEDRESYRVARNLTDPFERERADSAVLDHAESIYLECNESQRKADIREQVRSSASNISELVEPLLFHWKVKEEEKEGKEDGEKINKSKVPRRAALALITVAGAAALSFESWYPLFEKDSETKYPLVALDAGRGVLFHSIEGLQEVVYQGRGVHADKQGITSNWGHRYSASHEDGHQLVDILLASSPEFGEVVTSATALSFSPDLKLKPPITLLDGLVYESHEQRGRKRILTIGGEEYPLLGKSKNPEYDHDVLVRTPNGDPITVSVWKGRNDITINDPSVSVVALNIDGLGEFGKISSSLYLVRDPALPPAEMASAIESGDPIRVIGPSMHYHRKSKLGHWMYLRTAHIQEPVGVVVHNPTQGYLHLGTLNPIKN